MDSIFFLENEKLQKHISGTFPKTGKFQINANNDHCVKSVQIRSYFWSEFSRIRTEYGEIRSISPYLVLMRENTDQK